MEKFLSKFYLFLPKLGNPPETMPLTLDDDLRARWRGGSPYGPGERTGVVILFGRARRHFFFASVRTAFSRRVNVPDI